MKKSGFTLIELLVCISGITTLIGVILILSLLVKGCNHIQDKGVKNIAEQIWNGSDSDSDN